MQKADAGSGVFSAHAGNYQSNPFVIVIPAKRPSWLSLFEIEPLKQGFRFQGMSDRQIDSAFHASGPSYCISRASYRAFTSELPRFRAPATRIRHLSRKLASAACRSDSVKVPSASRSRNA